MGANGYRHYQIRLVSSNPHFFEWVQNNIGVAHVEKGNTEWNDYERKSGNFACSEDTDQIRQIRFGNLRELQKKILKEVNHDQGWVLLPGGRIDKSGDRRISVYLDSTGNHGKTWLSLHLYEIGKACIVPRASCTPEKASAYICSAYRGEEYIIFDIPRSRKIDAGLYEVLEEIKDGLVFDHRYTGKCRNIRGVKLIVFTNTPLDTKKLSHDRWCLHGIREDARTAPTSNGSL